MSQTRVTRTQTRVRVRRRAYVAIPAAVLVLAVSGYLLFRGGSALVGGVTHLGDGSTPPFEFELVRTLPISVAAGAKDARSEPATRAAEQVVPVMEQLYSEAFLNPSDWKHNSYDTVWSLFDETASREARIDVDVLTAGTTAGDTYDTVTPDSGRLTIKVLLDKRNQAATLVAIVTFTADAKGKDGTTTLVQSSGQYFLRETDDGWIVYSYKVVRDDQLLSATPTPAGSGSPTGATS